MRPFCLLVGLLIATPCLADNIYIVNAVGDGGAGTLRAAINQMPSGSGVQTIRFEIAGTASIVLSSPLPALVGQSIVLDGSASPNLRIEGAGWPMLKFHSALTQTIQFNRIHLRNGSSADGSGCVDVRTGGSLLVFDSSFDSCVTTGPAGTGSGGGAIKTNGSLRLTRSRFTGNVSTDGGFVGLVNAGGAVYASGASILVESSQFFGNRTHASPSTATICRGGTGGAVALNLPAGGSAVFVDTQFVDNATICPSTGSRQAGSAGALYLTGQGTSSVVALDRTYFGRNEAQEAGAVAGHSVRLNVTNSTFFENTGFSVGGIYLLTRTGSPATTIQLRNATFARNASSFSTSAAHLHLQNGATATEVRNTVFAQPVTGPACFPATSNVQSGAVVFTSDTSCFFFLPGGEGISSQFPGNGFGLTAATQTWGPIPSVHPPAGSVLIDNGSNSNCPAVDARGLPRPINGGQSTTCDVGAVEVQPNRIFGNGFDA